MKKRIFALLLCLVCALSLGGCQPEQIDYDTSPLSFETVFDDTPGNPDKPDQPEDFAFHVSHHPPAYRVRTYDFEEDTICKGAFYILSPEDSYEIEELPPEKGIIKGVFTCDYTKQGNGIRIHRFTLSYETADSITVRNTQIYGKGLQPVSFEGSEFATDLRITLPISSINSKLWFSGDFDYNGEEYSFNINL